MKQTIRLNETDLSRIVRRVIYEELQNNEDVLCEGKLHDLVKRYGAAAVFAAAMAEGIAGGVAAYKSGGCKYHPTYHIWGQNMPANHKALIDTYDLDQDGEMECNEPDAFHWRAVGPHAQEVNQGLY